MSEQLPKIEILQEGDGKTLAKPGDVVTIHYVGTLTNGKKFDSSRDRGKPFTCVAGVGQVIAGWDIALTNNFGKGLEQPIYKGSKAVLTIPSELAYKDRGFPGLIPPNSTLVFEIELLDIASN